MNIFRLKRRSVIFLLQLSFTLLVVNYYLKPGEDYFIPRREITHSLNYTWLITPPDCRTKTDLLILVLSVFHSAAKRNSIRETWGRVDKKSPWYATTFNYSVKLVFLVGAYEDATISFDAESKQYGDVMQINVTESYQTPSIKILMAFKWMEERCQDVKYVLKADDDVFVNIPLVLSEMKAKKGAYLFGDKLFLANTKRLGRHRVRFHEYPFILLPPYLLGYTYFMPAYVARRLLNASYHVPFFTYEDVYITGVLAKATHTQHVQMHPSWLEVGSELKKCDFVGKKLFAAPELDIKTIYDVWETFVNSRKCFR